MAYTTINKSSDHFNTKLYAGNSGTQALTGIGHQPDLVWIKNRNDSNNQSNVLYDAVRGVTKYISSNSTAAEGTEAAGVTAFGTDGFTVGNTVTVNTGFNYVAWNWKANGAGSANTDGSINTTSTSVNTTAGFSISKWTSTGSNATIGHGLGVAPKVILTKVLGTTQNWFVFHQSLFDTGSDRILNLNTNGAYASGGTIFQSTAPTSSVFSVGTSFTAHDYIAYCFAEKTGFSKFGSYTGTDDADGPFIFCGFKPAFFLVKMTTSGSESWSLYDNKRLGYNPAFNRLYPNLSNVEATETKLDFVSNGIKIRSAGDGHLNQTAKNYIYMAFAEAPLVGSNNIPATAR